MFISGAESDAVFCCYDFIVLFAYHQLLLLLLYIVWLGKAIKFVPKLTVM